MCNLWCLSYFSLQGKCFPGGVRGTVSAAGERGRERRRQGALRGVSARGGFFGGRGSCGGKGVARKRRQREAGVARPLRAGDCLRGEGAFAGREVPLRESGASAGRKFVCSRKRRLPGRRRRKRRRRNDSLSARDYFFSGLLPRTIMSAKEVAVSFTQSRWGSGRRCREWS